MPSHLASEIGTTKLDAYIAPLGPERNPAALALARELRRAGLSVEVGDGTFKAGKSLETAEKKARRILFIGDFESKAGIFVVKDFASERSRLFARRDLEKELRKAAWKVVVPLADSPNPQEQVIGIRLPSLQILDMSENPLNQDALRIFLALSLGIPPKKLPADTVERAVSDLTREGFIESVGDGLVLSSSGRAHLAHEMQQEQNEQGDDE